MKLILLKGKDDSGKTTTAAFVHDELLKKGAYKKYYKELHEDYKRGEKGWDFRSELEFEDKIIHIISRGDERNYFNDHIFPQYDRTTNVDVLILCVRIDEKDARISNSMEEFVMNKFSNIIDKRIDFQMEYVEKKDDKEIIEAKKKTAQEIVKYIIDEISKQNEN